MKKGDIYLGRKILYMEKFPSTGTFEAIGAAESRLHDLGYEIGSMCRNEPIGFADGDKYHYVAKWYNIREEEKQKLDGVIISDDFREGSCEVLFFNPPKL